MVFCKSKLWSMDNNSSADAFIYRVHETSRNNNCIWLSVIRCFSEYTKSILLISRLHSKYEYTICCHFYLNHSYVVYTFSGWKVEFSAWESGNLFCVPFKLA